MPETQVIRSKEKAKIVRIVERMANSEGIIGKMIVAESSTALKLLDYDTVLKLSRSPYSEVRRAVWNNPAFDRIASLNAKSSTILRKEKTPSKGTGTGAVL